MRCLLATVVVLALMAAPPPAAAQVPLPTPDLAKSGALRTGADLVVDIDLKLLADGLRRQLCPTGAEPVCAYLDGRMVGGGLNVDTMSAATVQFEGVDASINHRAGEGLTPRAGAWEGTTSGSNPQGGGTAYLELLFRVTGVSADGVPEKYLGVPLHLISASDGGLATTGFCSACGVRPISVLAEATTNSHSEGG